jgi:hypothetical protein
MSGNKGIMESPRELANQGGTQHTYVKADEYDGEHTDRPAESYDPVPENAEASASFGHGGSDFYSMYNFVERILGNENTDTIDVYEALDMFLPGMFAFRSILNNGQRMEIPDLRDKSIRDQWRNDTACVDPKVAGDQLLPTRADGTPQIPDSVYEAVKDKWDEAQRTGNDFYRNAAFSQGAGTK